VKPIANRILVVALLIGIVSGSLVLLFSGEPYYRGRPVSHWALDYSQQLYPNGTAPLSPSQEGLDALRKMGPRKAAAALIRALMQGDSRFYEKYRAIYPRLPGWYQNRFPLRLTLTQKVALILGSTEFFDVDYQTAMIPFVIAELERPDPAAQIAACQLLASMPQAASPALPALTRLTTSPNLAVAQAAQAAVARITPSKNAQ
jgi:hypothetical protein